MNVTAHEAGQCAHGEIKLEGTLDWHQVWGTERKFLGPNFRMIFFRKKFPFNAQKILMTILVIDCILCIFAVT